MSDSDDEAAFASADEGESTQKTQSKKPASEKSVTGAVGSTETEKKGGKKQKKKGKKGAKAVKDTQKETVKPEPTKKSETVETDSKPKPDVKPEKDTSDSTPSQSKDVKTEAASPSHQEISKVKPEDVKKNDEDNSNDRKESTEPASDQPKDASEKVSQSERDVTPKKMTPPPTAASPQSQNIPRTPQTQAAGEEMVVEEDPEPEQKSSGGWGWGSWGSSLISAASSSVSTFTSQVGEGFTTIVDSVESSLGAPPAEEIARLEKEQAEKAEAEAKEKGDKSPDTSSTESPKEGETATSKETPEEEKSEGGGKEGGGWFSSLGVSGITTKIQSTGKSLVSGSLDAVEALATGSIDVLENIGKKTINVLSEHDPGFKKTKNVMLGDRKQNLSSMLREAKEKAESEATEREEQEEARKHNYGAVFDDFQGLAHLEALEILSNQSEKKVQALLSSLPADSVSQLKPQLIAIKNLFELDDSDYEEREEHDFSKLITDLLSELHLGTTPDKLNRVQEKNRMWVVNFYADPADGEEKKTITPKEIFHAAIEALAELTAKSVEQFHKAGELVLLQKDSDTSYEKRSKSLASLTQVLCTEVSILSTKFTQCLHKAGEDIEDPSVITPFVTNVYLEASNSSTYIQDGFQLLLPVLQQAAIQDSPLLKS